MEEGEGNEREGRREQEKGKGRALVAVGVEEEELLEGVGDEQGGRGDLDADQRGGGRAREEAAAGRQLEEVVGLLGAEKSTRMG